MKKNVQTKPLSQVQLFVTKRNTLEQKISSYYENTQNVSDVIQYAVAIMVKNALVLSDYSEFLKELVRELFLHAEPSEVLRKNLCYFKPYFKSGEFDKVVNRLFKNRKEYLQFSEEARSICKYLHTEDAPAKEDAKYGYHLVSVFKAASEKKHSWILRNIDPAMSKEEAREKTRALLKVLTTLTIFEQNGSRKFAQLVKFDYIESANVMHYEESQELLKESDQNSEDAKETLTIMVPHGFDPRTLSDAEAIVLIQAHLPEGKTLADIEVLFVERPADSAEAADPADPVFDPPVISNEVQQESHEPESASIKEDRAIGVADPPETKSTPKRSTNNRPLSGRQLSALSLINNRERGQSQQTSSGKRSGKKKGGSGSQKNKKRKK
ncbi:hypothetical protein [Enterococcus malodoratus]|uniref:hypothetical protein n=1 Tax=Enterococcus malodoratus TaxID=71451 RepID=UPI0020740160|nr:hypothetical protein [Enterococcus malodoratus]